VAAIRADRAALNKALLDTTAKTQTAEERLGALENRLGLLQSSEAAIRRSLEGRRNLIAEVLAALQRIGRRPPPAVLVRPEDILEAVAPRCCSAPSCPDSGRRSRSSAPTSPNSCGCATASPPKRPIGAEMEQIAAERLAS
jgi:hypothetical protein